MKIKNITKRNYDGKVFNIEVRNNHNYFVNGILASNCHEDSVEDGEHGLLDAKFIDTLKPYTELAIGGGNPLSHPELVLFLNKLKERKIIANLTVNQIHFEKNYELLMDLMEEKLIYGLGVSLVNPTGEFISLVQQNKNIVIHLVSGIVSKKQLEKLQDKDLKILLLGYKFLRRGKTYYSEVIEDKIQMLHNLLKNGMMEHFKVVSFDNLAIKQLKIRELVSEEVWNEFYMGDDGQHTMYIDMVNREFSKSSTCKQRFSITENIIDMFSIVKGM
jgi:hypothetical protein